MCPSWTRKRWNRVPLNETVQPTEKISSCIINCPRPRAKRCLRSQAGPRCILGHAPPRRMHLVRPSNSGDDDCIRRNAGIGKALLRRMWQNPSDAQTTWGLVGYVQVGRDKPNTLKVLDSPKTTPTWDLPDYTSNKMCHSVTLIFRLFSQIAGTMETLFGNILNC